MELQHKINDILDYLATQGITNAEIGLVLGSGIGAMADTIIDKKTIPYQNIPHLPASTAPGHSGNLVIGTLGNKKVIAMQGRIHLYEGNNPALSTILVRVMKKLGVSTIIITCAAGGLNPTYRAEDIAIITDHINLAGTNPLVGKNLDEFGPRFPVMYDIYNPQYVNTVQKIALANSIRVHPANYGAILGPTYLTRAEARFMLRNGCDLVGMSVIHEAIIAAHSGIKILGLAAITDMVLPDSYSEHHASEQEVIETGKKIVKNMQFIIMEFLKQI